MANRNYLPVKLHDGYYSAGNLNRHDIDLISGWYSNFASIENTGSAGANSFTLLYLDGYALYDRYKDPTAIAGGTAAANVTFTETYVCPTRASGVPSWSDVLSYTAIDQIENPNLIRARKKNREPYTYTTIDGYVHQMYLLFGFTQIDVLVTGNPLHCFYWAYCDSTSGFLQVPASDPGLPLFGELFDIWVPTSLNVARVPWSAGLVQDFDVLPVSSGGGASWEFSKQPFTIPNTPTMFTGQIAFTTVDLSNLYGTNKVMLGFLNGVEVDCAVIALGAETSANDIIFDVNSAGYPAVTDVYWNGTFRATSGLGDLKNADLIRIYVPEV